MAADPQKLFPQVHGEGLASSVPGDPAVEAAVEQHGLHGFQLLSRCLRFERLAPDSEAARVIATLSAAPPNTFFYRLEDALGCPLTVFRTVPGAGGAGGSYDAAYDSSRQDFHMLHLPTAANRRITSDNCIVLGMCGDFGSGSTVFSQRLGAARGAAVHDSTSFAPASNLVGPILSTHSAYDCVLAGSLAPMRLAFAPRGPLCLPPDGEASAPTLRALRAWCGVAEEHGRDGPSVIVHDPRRYFFDATFDDDARVKASAHDFHCMAQLLDLFDPGNGPSSAARGPPIKKPIVFCPTNQVARRCMAVFKAMAAQRSREAAAAGDSMRAELFGSIGADHIFQSDVYAPGAGQSYARRQQLVWRYKGAARHVLFNRDLLSTGVDLPCCDCTFQHSPTKVQPCTIHACTAAARVDSIMIAAGAALMIKKRPISLLSPMCQPHVLPSPPLLVQNPTAFLQRAGRDRRLDPANPGKVATLAMPCPDPYAPDEDQVLEWQRLGLEGAPNKDKRSALHASFDLQCKVAECLLDPSLPVLGRLISVVTGGRRGGRAVSGANNDVGGEGESLADAKKEPGPGGSLLSMMICRRGEPSLTLPLGDADVAVMHAMCASTGRPLLPPPASVEQWMAVMGRWRDEQTVPGVQPDQRAAYNDAEFGVVQLGAWLNSRKNEARGTRGDATAQKAARALMPKLQAVLGLADSNWWFAQKQQKCTTEQWLEMLGRWRAQHPGTQRPVISLIFEDGKFGRQRLGAWLDYQVAKARGLRCNAATQKTAQELMPKVQQVLRLADANWWRADPSPEEWLEVLGRWKMKPPPPLQGGRRRAPTHASQPTSRATYNDRVFGEVALGPWLQSRKYEARKGHKESLALMPRIQAVLGLADDNFWRPLGEGKPKSVKQWLEVLGRWRADQLADYDFPRQNDDDYDDSEFGDVKLGGWVHNCATQARRELLKAQAAEGGEEPPRKALALVVKIQEVLGLDDNWWKLTTLTNDQWMEVLTRWAAQAPKGMLPAQRDPPYNDAVFGRVNLGNWFRDIKVLANGNKKGTPAARAMMLRMQQVLGLADPDWWKTS